MGKGYGVCGMRWKEYRAYGRGYIGKKTNIRFHIALTVKQKI